MAKKRQSSYPEIKEAALKNIDAHKRANKQNVASIIKAVKKKVGIDTEKKSDEE